MVDTESGLGMYIYLVGWNDLYMRGVEVVYGQYIEDGSPSKVAYSFSPTVYATATIL